jgi:type II secretory pathway pseudopilin PulG
MKKPHESKQLRGGFTITELLVVTAIMLTMMSFVLTGARGSRTSGNVRRGAQQLASILLASQSVSLGSPTGAAVIIDSQGRLGGMVSQGRRFPFIEGVVEQGLPPTDAALSATSQTILLRTTNDDVSSLVNGYKIRFLDRGQGVDGPVSEWFSLSCPTPPVAVASIRSENGQTPNTCLWPKAAASGTLSFQAARYPIPAGFSQSLPEGVAIDLRHSGYEGMANWESLAGKGAIAVGFDSVGAVDSLMQNVLPAAGQFRTIQPISPCEQIYFFVTLRADVEAAILDSTVNTLASDKALWVVVHPRTGRVTIAANVPQIAADATALRAARAKARQGTSIGG